MKIKILPYKSDFAQDFYDLNIEWLESYFHVEPFDKEILSHPDKHIISKGGHIFFAEYNGEIVGTVALMPTNKIGILELTKMAVAPKHRGLNIGQQLMQYSIDFSRDKGYSSLLLYSNTKLKNAIYIYRKYGFVEEPIETHSPYVRGNIKMRLSLK
ncbi:GNAT family N-acetyltransferase [Mangrovimonas aestuarii]|uniref:GNAT family N-acetyltransferase n=1 Tax=Mangrovimonas aestuarii TaxID=3018443 RepID=UPI002378CAF6|nr:GNAT family N-acetyltransferase [Mangrovimonas aestuarii]